MLDIFDTRYFIRKPNVPDFPHQFVEMEPEMVNWNVWEKDKDAIQLMCTEHTEDERLWIVRALKRKSVGAIHIPDTLEKAKVTDAEMRAKFAEEEAMILRGRARILAKKTKSTKDV